MDSIQWLQVFITTALKGSVDLPTTCVIDDIAVAAKALCDGLLVAFPTETVYGLGADATNPFAIGKLFEAKGRPSDNPLIVHLSDLNCLPLAASRITPYAAQLLEAYSPGPITVVVKKNPRISDLATAGLDTVGIRIPRCEQTRDLLRLCDRPIAAPSANRSGRPSCTTWQSVLEDMDSRIDYVLKGAVCEIGIESSVVDCTGEYPVVLRPGATTLEQLQQVVPSTVDWHQKFGERGIELDDSVLPSPGLKHSHYQPRAEVRLVRSLSEIAQSVPVVCSKIAFAGMVDQDISMDSESREFVLFRRYESINQYAREFYEFLREADRRGAEVICLQVVPNAPLGAALFDRQRRAAGIPDSDSTNWRQKT